MADLGSLLGAAGVGGAIGQAIVRLELDTSKYTAEMKAAQAQTTASANAMGTSTSKFGSIAQTALLGAGVAVAAFAAISVKAFIESEKVMAQTEAVLKSTGGAANVTKEEVLALADRLRDLSGADNDAIQASENLLLTFRSIRNEAGKGNDIFNQTERAILDMATAMNGGAIPTMEDLHNTTIQVGKALNDPIQGMTALRRVGVSFTESQVKLITSLQESGDLMGAQKIVLGELNKEFGGAAKAAGDTFAGQLAILQSKLQDVAESVGESLMPALEGLIGVVTALLPLLEALAKLMEGLPIVQMGEDTDRGSNALIRFADVVIDTIPGLGHFVDLTHGSAEATDKATAAEIKGADALERQKDAVDAVVESMREQYDATLALADSTFGLIEATRDNRTAEHELAAAHHRVNELVREGKTDTKAYAEARRDLRDKALAAAESEATLAGAVRKLQQDIAEGKTSRDEAVDAIKALGKEAGLTGKDIQGLVRDVKSGLADAATTAQRLAPGIGRSISEGISGGIDEAAGAIAVSAERAVLRAMAAARSAADADSPSKEMAKLGLDMMEGLYIGITKGAQKAIDAARKEIEKLVDQIGSELDKVKGKAESFADSIRSGFSGFLDIGGAFSSAGEGADLSSVLAAQVSGAQQLASVLQALKAQGASQATLSQVAGAGAGFGQLLLQGGPELVTQMNESLKTISDLANQTGKGLSEAFFGEKIDRLEKRLERQNELLHDLVEIERLGHDHAIILDGVKVTEAIRNQLVRVGNRNPDIFGGRA